MSAIFDLPAISPPRALVSPDLPGKAIEQGVGARERVFGGGIIALIHFESSFAQRRFNADPERDELGMQYCALPAEIRLYRIGGSEIGSCPARRQGEMMPSLAQLGSFLSGESRGHKASDPEIFHFPAPIFRRYFLTTSPTAGFP